MRHTWHVLRQLHIWPRAETPPILGRYLRFGQIVGDRYEFSPRSFSSILMICVPGWKSRLSHESSRQLRRCRHTNCRKISFRKWPYLRVRLAMSSVSSVFLRSTKLRYPYLADDEARRRFFGIRGGVAIPKMIRICGILMAPTMDSPCSSRRRLFDEPFFPKVFFAATTSAHKSVFRTKHINDGAQFRLLFDKRWVSHRIIFSRFTSSSIFASLFFFSISIISISLVICIAF